MAMPITQKKWGNAKRIKDLNPSLRPLEKLIALGQSNLSDAELLALILSTGKRGQNVVSMSKKILKKFPLTKLSKVDLKQLETVPGIGKTKAARIKAAFELGERAFAPAKLNKAVIDSTESILDQIREIADKKQECLLVLYLNARHELLEKEMVGVGNLNTSLIEPKEILARALLSPCAFLILAHNHPSCDPTPSQEDINFTERLQKAAQIMGLTLLDHLIVCPSSYFSFEKNRILRR